MLICAMASLPHTMLIVKKKARGVINDRYCGVPILVGFLAGSEVQLCKNEDTSAPNSI